MLIQALEGVQAQVPSHSVQKLNVSRTLHAWNNFSLITGL